MISRRHRAPPSRRRPGFAGPTRSWWFGGLRAAVRPLPTKGRASGDVSEVCRRGPWLGCHAGAGRSASRSSLPAERVAPRAGTVRHVSEQQSSDWTGRENSGMEAKRGKGGGAGMRSESRGKEQGASGPREPPEGSGRGPRRRWEVRCRLPEPGVPSQATSGCCSCLSWLLLQGPTRLCDPLSFSGRKPRHRSHLLIHGRGRFLARPPVAQHIHPHARCGSLPWLPWTPVRGRCAKRELGKRRRGRALETLCRSFSR